MDIDILISLVFSKPPVWDKRDKRHSNRYVVDKCWREISAEMDVDENKLRKKWKYLRDQFATEYGKIPAPRSGDEASTSYEPKWPYYYSLMFLKDIVKARNSSGNLTKSLKRASSSRSVEQTNNSDDSKDIDTSTHHALEENSNDTNSVPRNKTKTTNPFNQSMLDIERKKLEYLEQKARKLEDDEHLLFLKSLLPHIRKIPQERLLSFRNDIQRTVDIYAYQSQFPRLSPSTLSSCSTEPHAIQSTRQTPEPYTTQSAAQPFHSTPIPRHTPELQATQPEAQSFYSPPITPHTPESHATQSVSKAFHAPISTYLQSFAEGLSEYPDN
ncbi:unnamed protein product [Acanthoscelides obtectus]|uniref:MADF domain-containing protein n=1 Tax=Acanthoscelides obtectus TaxID=200917 RepID=A0A9P0L073_ACAOB|nr:unnamed protein product [Acanthoscelides obtectus]CAK1650828.1 hypothetical protein AOBTE_LOCUS16918 [Acanthoscelides obtectus]